MRTVSLSSRLQWAFRGTVLPGALATGDVDNDGCKEFVVGSVQGELAIFRGRGGCGSWRYSEDQIEPEYDCWDAVERGEFPVDGIDTQQNEMVPGMKRRSTYTSLLQDAMSNRESVAVDDIMHLFEGSERDIAAHLDSVATSEDETSRGTRRGASLNPWDPEQTGHIKWEDALDIERDGRKPWVLAQNLGTISSVAVADISNSGHNSVIVVNGEGKCHIFDYPFKRRLHPEMVKRKRQRNHYRRFSQDRFFKDGIVVDAVDPHADHVERAAPSADGTVAGHGTVKGPGHGVGRAPASSAHPVSSADPARRPNLMRSKSTFAEAPVSYSATQIGEQARDNCTNSTSGPATRSSETFASKPTWRPLSGIEGLVFDSSHSGYLAPGTDSALPTSNVSSHADPPLTILNKHEGRESSSAAFHDVGGRDDEPGRLPSSPAAMRPRVTVAPSASAQGGFSAEVGSIGGRNLHHHHPDASDAGVESLCLAYGDGDADEDADSEQDFADSHSDIGDNSLLTSEEVADIEKIWGANIGKKSGDWFPFVLDKPDMTFSIPTNVEHALVADVDNNGLNELVLTATDGFVYIFRIEPSVKHAVKPTLSALGVFSNIPTTLPSVNMTGNGSPFMYMSAPRSPDASDFDLDYPGKGPKLPASNTRSQMSRAEKPLAAPAAEAAAEVESDLNLVNHLLKSIKDVSAPPSEHRADGGHTEKAQAQPVASGLAATSAAATAAVVPGTTQLPIADRRSGAERRVSLTSRMRENFTGIVSGWDATRRSISSFTQTAPSSINNSRAQTANNSGTSTNAHSRIPSISDDDTGADVETYRGKSALDLSTSNSETSSAAASKVSPAIQLSPATLAAASELRLPRIRNNTVSIGTVNVMEGIPERRSSEIDLCGDRDPFNTVGTPNSRMLSRASTHEPTSGETDGAALKVLSPLFAAQNDPTSVSGLVDTLALHRRVGSTSSRTNLRADGLVRSIGAGSSRGHSRHGSVSSVAKARVIPSVATAVLVTPPPMQPSDADFAPDQTHTPGDGSDSRRESRRTSLCSNVSAREDGTHTNSATAQLAAKPMEATVSARGSFTKPVYPQPPTRPVDADDNNSIISQVTERLAELTMKVKGKSPALAANDNHAAMTPMLRASYVNPYYEPTDREFVAKQLPPPRNVVDWSTASADKVATWFLDNIPGNVAVVNAPAKAFGAPVVQQSLNQDSDDLSDYSSSSCDCSSCCSDSEVTESSDSEAERRPPATMPPLLKPAVFSEGHAQIKALLPTSYVPYPGVTLPKTPGLGAINKKEPTAEDDNSDKPPKASSPKVNSVADDGCENILGQSPEDASTHRPMPLASDLQRFLILSKPGNRFVPIDMVNGAMMATVESPQVPSGLLTGGNTAHMMNVDTSGAMRNIQLAMSLGLSIPQLSGFDYAAISSSYVGQSSSWQSGSMPWAHANPASTYSYGSVASYAKSPAGAHEATMLLRSHPAAGGTATDSPSPPTSTAHRSSTEEPLISQFPSNEALSNMSAGSPSPRISQQIYSPMIPASATSSRQSQSSLVSNSVFNAGPGSGPVSLSSNMRSMRSMHRISTDGLRSQHFNPGYGPSPINRGMSPSGSMTPVAGGFPIISSQHDRGHLGFAGLRGYIGNGIGRQRSGGSTTIIRTDDGNPLSGYFSPGTGVPESAARGQSAGPIGPTAGSAIMPRDPFPGHSLSASTNASAANTVDRSGRIRLDSMRQFSRGNHNSPTVPGVPSASPQRGQQSMRYSPSVAAWSSFKEGSVLSTIRDQDDVNEGDDYAPEMALPNQANTGSERFPSEPLPNMPASANYASPFADDAAAHGRGYWMNTEPQSVRSQSSLGTGTGASTNPRLMSQEKEEEIEEAPQPMEMDVATYMVGGVAAGKRMRRRVKTESGSDNAGTTAGVDDHIGNCEEEYELNELVSLVTMDGIINCYDPARKVNHFISLNSNDPVLGIWKVKMHEDICRPSALQSMLEREDVDESSSELVDRMLLNTPTKRIFRQVGLSNRDLFHAVCYSTYVEERVNLVNRIETYRRRQARRRLLKARGQTRSGYGAMPGDNKLMAVASKREGPSPVLSRSNKMSRITKSGLNNRIRDNLNKYNRVGRVVRTLGNHIRDLAISSGGGSGGQQGAVDSMPALVYATPSQMDTGETRSAARGQETEANTPGMSVSPKSCRRTTLHQNMQVSASVTTTAANSGGMLLAQHGGVDQYDDANDATDEQDDGDNDGHNYGGGGAARARNSAGFGAHQSQRHFAFGTTSSSSNQLNSRSHLTSAPRSSVSIGAVPAPVASKGYGADIAAALNGWYGENKDDYRRSLRVSDHLVVSSWRGSTFFVDVSTLLDTAHYNNLFNHRWETNVADIAECVIAAATAAASMAEKDGNISAEARNCNLATVYGQLSEFSDISGVMSRLRANASVIQFKFQDTVSAFLADTYAPATGGPNVPCMFYVDYKDRIWTYYHLDEIAEMDDVYGATWFRGEPESLNTPTSRARAIECGADPGSYDKPFSVVDLAYRRINQDPWIPLIGDESYANLVNYNDCDYPYSAKTWRKRANSPGHMPHELDGQDRPQCNHNGQNQQRQEQKDDDDDNLEEGRSSPSETGTQAFVSRANANIAGRFHMSYLPGPHLCPIWADIKSVDLYDVGACNLLEIASPELLAVKEVFCKDLGLDPNSIDERVNLATIPGLSNWVHRRLYS
ncbi:hypothetical protein GGF37_000166 [Kickxella alabastrina]|nr:hypothetical protein GGF37_000166 [Kickxella alabastrina]